MKALAVALVATLIAVCGCMGHRTQATVTVTQPAPSAPATMVSTRPGIFVGTWYGHGRGLVVLGDGQAAETYRTYTFCSQDPTTPCDQDSGNVITDGGRVRLHITRVVTANHMSTATATVLTTTDPAHAPAGSTLTLVLAGDIITLDGTTFCDTKADAQGLCGA
jgi:hypothetical protein